jgi:hypothetical protein
MTQNRPEIPTEKKRLERGKVKIEYPYGVHKIFKDKGVPLQINYIFDN